MPWLLQGHEQMQEQSIGLPMRFWSSILGPPPQHKTTAKLGAEAHVTQHRWHTQNIKLISAYCTIRKHPHRMKFHLTLFFFFFWQKYITGNTRCFTNSCILSTCLSSIKAKSIADMYSQYLGFSTQKYWGRGLLQTFYFILSKTSSKLKPTHSDSRFSRKITFSPKHSQPWSVLECCSSASIFTRASSGCKLLPSSAHCRAWCSSSRTSPCKNPTDLHHAPHLQTHIAKRYSGAHVGDGGPSG